jgi:integrase
MTLISTVSLRRVFKPATFDLRGHLCPDNPWLAWALHIAHTTAEARGWRPAVRDAMRRTLVHLLAHHADGDVVTIADAQTVARHYSVRVEHAIDILSAMDVFLDNAPSTFDSWIEAKLEGLSPGIHGATHRWVLALRNGDSRTRTRRVESAQSYLRSALPALRHWSKRYDHLREVTEVDFRDHLRQLQGHPRRDAFAALRSLFKWARRADLVFHNPTAGTRVGSLPQRVWQPLTNDELAQAVAAAGTPRAKLCIALAAIHAARPGHIRALRIDDVDLPNRRLRINGHDRPLDPTTYALLRDWLTIRAQTWPDTANRHVLINHGTAIRHEPVGKQWIFMMLRGLRATTERLRIDRQLEEAIASEGDPLRLAEMFAICEETAVRYTANARLLMPRPHEKHPLTSGRTPGPTRYPG